MDKHTGRQTRRDDGETYIHRDTKRQVNGRERERERERDLIWIEYEIEKNGQ